MSRFAIRKSLVPRKFKRIRYHHIDLRPGDQSLICGTQWSPHQSSNKRWKNHRQLFCTYSDSTVWCTDGYWLVVSVTLSSDFPVITAILSLLHLAYKNVLWTLKQSDSGKCMFHTTLLLTSVIMMDSLANQCTQVRIHSPWLCSKTKGSWSMLHMLHWCLQSWYHVWSLQIGFRSFTVLCHSQLSIRNLVMCKCCSRRRNCQHTMFPFNCQGIARTQSPTTKNCTPEFPTFGGIADFNQARCNALASIWAACLHDRKQPAPGKLIRACQLGSYYSLCCWTHVVH